MGREMSFLIVRNHAVLHFYIYRNDAMINRQERHFSAMFEILTKNTFVNDRPIININCLTPQALPTPLCHLSSKLTHYKEQRACHMASAYGQRIRT